MDGSVGAAGGAAAVVAIVGILLRTAVRLDRHARYRARRRPGYTPPPTRVAAPPAPHAAPARITRDRRLTAQAVQDASHTHKSVRTAAMAYLRGDFTDAQYAALRPRLLDLARYTPPRQDVEDEIPPEYRGRF